MEHFELHEESSHWKLFHQKSEVDISTCLVPDLSKAISNFPSSFSGDVLLLKRPIEPIPAIRAVVATIDPEITVDVSFSPRDILIATWRIEKVGTTVIRYRQYMAAIDTLCPITGEDITQLLDILLEPEKFSTEETIETDQMDPT